MRFRGFIGPAYTLESVNMDCQQCVNMYPVIDENGTGKEAEVAYLQGTPGTLQRYTFPQAPVRGMFAASDGNNYAVAGSDLYKLNPDYSTSLVGTGMSFSNRYVSIDDNGTQLCIVGGTNGYVYTFATSTLARITSSGFSGADNAVFFDGYMIVNTPHSYFLTPSSLNDASTYDPLDKFGVTGSPNPILKHINIHRELWILKRTSIEVWYNTGDLNNPFQRETGIFIEQGCVSGDTVVKVNNTLVWVGADKNGTGTVYMANGYVPQRVSNYHVELLIAKCAVSDLQAWGYQDKGHVFYCLNVGTTTIVLDLTTQNWWHERQYRNPINGELTRHKAFCAITVGTTTLVGSVDTAQVFELSSAHYLDDTSPILRIRSSPHVSKDLNRIKHKWIQLDMEVGTPLEGNAPETIEPQVMLDMSEDDGRTWYTRQRGVGFMGQYKHRVKINKLGVARNRVYRVRFTEPYFFALLGAELEVEALQS